MVSREARHLGRQLVRSDSTCLPLPTGSTPLTDFTPYCDVKRSVPGALSAKGLTLSRFALLVSFVPDVQRMVRDCTELAEAYDIDMEFAPPGGAGNQELPSIMTALREQLGLELRPAEGPVSVLVIDQVEPPAPD